MVSTIACVDDYDEKVEVILFQHVGEIETAAGARCFPGAQRWALASGEAVSLIDENTYQIDTTEELLRRIV